MVLMQLISNNVVSDLFRTNYSIYLSGAKLEKAVLADLPLAGNGSAALYGT